jgi:hypothetical protein
VMGILCVCVCCVLLSSLQFCFLFFVFVLFLHVCGDRDLAAHMHILGKCWVLVLLCVEGVETVEKEVIGGRSTCWCSHRSNWVAHNLCEARSTLKSGTSPTGCHTWQIWGYRWVYGGG